MKRKGQRYEEQTLRVTQLVQAGVSRDCSWTRTDQSVTECSREPWITRRKRKVEKLGRRTAARGCHSRRAPRGPFSSGLSGDPFWNGGNFTREIMRYRSRLCQRGDLDKEVPITFAPTALIQSIRFLIAVAAHYGIHLELNDIYTKTTRKFT